MFGTPVFIEPSEIKNVSLILHDDTFIETNETLMVEMNGTDIGDGIRRVRVTIVDDDGELRHDNWMHFVIGHIVPLH